MKPTPTDLLLLLSYPTLSSQLLRSATSFFHCLMWVATVSSNKYRHLFLLTTRFPHPEVHQSRTTRHCTGLTWRNLWKKNKQWREQYWWCKHYCSHCTGRNQLTLQINSPHCFQLIIQNVFNEDFLCFWKELQFQTFYQSEDYHLKITSIFKWL